VPPPVRASTGLPADTGGELSPFPRELLEGDPVSVAPRLLNALVRRGDRMARIVEVEAYGGQADAASHAFRGETRRNRSMFGPAGTLYVYRSYGVHACANVTVGPVGTPAAVLIRAGVLVPPIASPAVGSQRDGAGPGLFCRIVGLTTADDGADLCDPRSGIQLLRDRQRAPEALLVGTRVGLGVRAGAAAHFPWRFGVPGSASLSRRFVD
jgi:DNA-3-methyladenine glycosylase